LGWNKRKNQAAIESQTIDVHVNQGLAYHERHKYLEEVVGTNLLKFCPDFLKKMLDFD
jgi:hypothetical protein